MRSTNITPYLTGATLSTTALEGCSSLLVRIDVDLRLTCRQIADETRGLPFNLNALHISSFCMADAPETLGRITFALQSLIRAKKCFMFDATYSGCLGPKLRSRLTYEYPDSRSVIKSMSIDHAIEDLVSQHWKEVPSVSRHVVMSTLEAVAAQPQHADSIASLRHLEREGMQLADTLSLWYEPWIIPTEDDLEIFTAAFSPQGNNKTWLSDIMVDQWREKIEKGEYSLCCVCRHRFSTDTSNLNTH